MPYISSAKLNELSVDATITPGDFLLMAAMCLRTCLSGSSKPTVARSWIACWRSVAKQYPELVAELDGFMLDDIHMGGTDEMARHSGAVPMPAPLLIDNSLSILNRTGAYHIAKDICSEFVPVHARVRHWRFGSKAPENLIRKIAARLMMLEISWLRDSEFGLIREKSRKQCVSVFLDPLYVMRSELKSEDIVLCHDVGPLTHSDLYDPRTVENYRVAYEKIRRSGPGVVFVSDWSKGNFVSLFGSDFRFLKTIPLYVRTELFEGPSEPLPGVDGPFFLTVGAFETRKNQVASLEAYAKGGFRARGVEYVLCGPRGDGHERIVELSRRLPGVVLPGYVPDNQLRWLYANAEAFVLPSRLEGFGMPALEAAYMGLLPIVSEGSALVEAVSGVCRQVPPDDPIAISREMANALARTPYETKATSRKLKELAAQATKQRFLSEWRQLLLDAADTGILPDRGADRTCDSGNGAVPSR